MKSKQSVTPASGGDLVWARWMVETARRLGKPEPQPETYKVIPRGPGRSPEIRWDEPPPYPRLVAKGIDRYRDELVDFARAYAPEVVRHEAWKPTRETTKKVLLCLDGIHRWASRAVMAVMITGGVTLGLGTGRDGGLEGNVLYDDAFTLLLAFARLTSRFIGRFHSCPHCTKPFVASGRQECCSPKCATLRRMRRYRARHRGERKAVARQRPGLPLPEAPRRRRPEEQLLLPPRHHRINPRGPKR